MKKYNYKNIVHFVAMYKTTAKNILAELISIADTYGYALLADQLDESYGWTLQSIYEAEVVKHGKSVEILD